MIKVVLPSRINTGTVVSRITFALKKKKKDAQENWIGNLQDGEKNNQRAFVFSWLYVKIHFMKEF